jgi:S-adenosylmethionine synthetase
MKQERKILFSSESVSCAHPDKAADAISDAILDAHLDQDPEAHVACETAVTTDFVLIMGEITSKAVVNHKEIARNVIREIGFYKPELKFDGNTCEIMDRTHTQSPDINQGVNRGSIKEQGAGDQGIMFGHATREGEGFMPIPIMLAHKLLEQLRSCFDTTALSYLRPDAKSQVTMQYNQDGTPFQLDTIVISTQHNEFADDDTMANAIHNDLLQHVIEPVRFQLGEPHWWTPIGVRILTNPTGKFVIGGPHGDSGLTGRKIIVDTYGGAAPHGGGAFSGKDPSKVDRSAAYFARWIAKSLVYLGVCDKVDIQLAYAIGVAEPVGFLVNTFGTAKGSLTDREIERILTENIDMRPGAILERLQLKNPIYKPTTSLGHFGRDPYSLKDKNGYYRNYFTWEDPNLDISL